ncbi:HDOD domain-containing protein [Ideonella paludis]|uniref:HDOD domain-containing protein n=1 Tax=Ideonella paludis TaxID=1233411 RepID=A0ABS5DXB6_9BURK|nr:HDOD domain-containing protein [Ideonella paludis]MBQ0935714.1 HDOD domain-containing protein [Ideonella paludis]
MTPFFAQLLSGEVQLPTVPRVIRELLQALRDDSASLADVAAQVALDPVLTSRVLQIANSAHYASDRPLSSVRDAVAVMGLRAVEGVLLLHGSVGAFQKTAHVDLPAFWRRAVVTGTCARQWARRWGAPEDQAQSAGLLQGMGHIILCHCLPDQAEQAFGAMPSQLALCSSHELAERELLAFGVAHPEVSAWWAAEIGLPDTAADAIEHSLQPPDANAPALTRALIAACVMNTQLEQGIPADQAMVAVEQAFAASASVLPDLSEDAAGRPQ